MQSLIDAPAGDTDHPTRTAALKHLDCRISDVEELAGVLDRVAETCRQEPEAIATSKSDHLDDEVAAALQSLAAEMNRKIHCLREAIHITLANA